MAGVTTTLAYNAENRVVRITQGLTVTGYAYDGDGAKVWEAQQVGATTPVTTVFLGAVALTISPTGRITRTYYFVNGQRIALREQRSDGMVVYFLHADHLGSAALGTGLTGTVVSSLRYTPYGLPRGETSRLPTPYRYTGQREMGVGFYDYQARLYDPAVGRFAQADTLVPEAGQPQSLNRYAYGLGNPLKYIDPTGHFSEEQLNWLGYYRDQTSESTWNLLLTLQPEDWMVVSHSNPNGDGYHSVAGQLGLALRHTQEPGQPLQFGLFVFGKGENSAGKVVELLEWIGADVGHLSVMRDTPDGPTTVWEAGEPQGLWGTPIKQQGYIQTDLGATQARQFSSLIEYLLGFPLLLNLFYLDTSINPGESAGDIHMIFNYYDMVNKTYYSRSIWLRPDYRIHGPMPIISDTWFENLR